MLQKKEGQQEKTHAIHRLVHMAAGIPLKHPLFEERLKGFIRHGMRLLQQPIRVQYQAGAGQEVDDTAIALGIGSPPGRPGTGANRRRRPPPGVLSEHLFPGKGIERKSGFEHRRRVVVRRPLVRIPEIGVEPRPVAGRRGADGLSVAKANLAEVSARGRIVGVAEIGTNREGSHLA